MLHQISSSSLRFKVRKNLPELITPASSTPHEIKLLSDIDDQKSLRYYLASVQIFRYHPSMDGKDPIQVLREALAKTLIFYYPLAGRLRECPNGKLEVDCNEKGVMFIEAEADVTIEEFGIDLHPPIPCFDELLYDATNYDQIIDSPIVIFQVTRLKCGGLICAMKMIHAMFDGVGMNQFIDAMAEIARGAPKPSILPVWCRELLFARDRPTVTCIHNEYKQLPRNDEHQQLPHDNKNNPQNNVSFFVGSKEIAAIRSVLPHNIAQSSSTFEVLTAWLWRCHTTALHWQNQDQEIRLMCTSNARFEPCRLNPPIPDGFYGNAFVVPAVVSTVRELCNRPLEYAVDLVKKIKNGVTEEYVHSVADLMAIKGRPYLTMTGSFGVSDLTKVNSSDVDYGWGKSLYNAVARTFHGECFYVPCTNSNGEQGKLVLTCLPHGAVERFEKELNGMLKSKDVLIMLKSKM